MYILCFGNPYIEEDNAVINISDELIAEGYNIIKCTSPEEIMFYTDKEFIILDVAKGISKPVIIDDAKNLNFNNMISLHDFDLNFFLKLFNELGHKFKVVAIPFNYNRKKLKEEIKKILDPLNI